MGLTFDNPNNLNKMLDKFAVVPDPKKTPKKPDSKDKKDKKSKD
ncbi:SPJ_0845 family protein [Lactobacillus sp. PSON]